jgi:F420-non-reducing hydrogenase iron-sulfur subunit
MVIQALPRQLNKTSVKTLSPKAQITVFHCVNALQDTSFLENEDYAVRGLKLPCSSMAREVVLLRAFEAGADAVMVLVCPEGDCHYLQGNLRVAKRVARVKKILDEIGLDGRRLNIYNIPHGDQQAVSHIVQKTVSELAEAGRRAEK